MIAISENAEGCILPVRAQPGARKNAVLGEHGGALKVAVTAPPQDGRANKALVEVVCETLKLKSSQVEVLHGESSRNKKLLIHCISRIELENRLKGLAKADQ